MFNTKMYPKLCFIFLAFIPISKCDYAKRCKVTNPNPDLKSHISLFDELNQCGVPYHVNIPTRHHCENLKMSNKSDWALSISTHGTCVTAWYNYDCTGWSVQFKPEDGNSHSDLRNVVVDGILVDNWKNNIRSLSKCDYQKKCKVFNPNPDLKSHISLFNELNHCGISYHVEIPTKHYCVKLLTSNKSDWALSISTHDTCVTAWYNYDCTGPSVQLNLDNKNSYSDLSSMAVAGKPEKNWKKNIGSLSKCDYEKKCEVTIPKLDSKSNSSLFDQHNHCGVSYNVDMPTKHTCVNLKTSSNSKWALSINTHGTCVTSWYNNDCTGPSVQLNLDNGKSYTDLSSIALARNSDKSWKKNIGSLSSCDYEKKCEVTNPKPDSESHISLFDELNQCGVSYHVEIPTKHHCVNLMASGKSDWAVSISTHGTCVRAWYNNACTGTSVQLNLDNGKSHSDLSSIVIESNLDINWKKNIGSLSRCGYERCQVTDIKSLSKSHISLFDELNQCGVSYHVDIPTKHHCENLKTSNKSDWALSISTHDTCVKAWYNYYCTGSSVQLEPYDGKSHSDLSGIAVEGKPGMSWKMNIGSLSSCDYEKKCEVTNPMSDSESHISLFDQLNQCGVSFHVDILTNHTCENLKTSNKSDWALSISTHNTCVKAWFDYDCTGPFVQLNLENKNSHSDLSGIAVEGASDISWKENIGSLSSCDYEKIVIDSTIIPLSSTTLNPGKENETTTMHNNSIVKTQTPNDTFPMN